MESPLYETADPDLKVLETLRWSANGGFVRLDMHLGRAERTCRRLRFSFLRTEIDTALAMVPRETDQRVRLAIARDGTVDLTTADIGEEPLMWRVAISATHLQSNDPWLAVKTTRRAVYDAARAAMPDGVDETILLNESDAVCEGTITNVFVRKGPDMLTPALACGLLPGVLRQSLLEQGKVKEAFLTVSDLHAADALFVGNSLRGLIAAKLV